MVCLCFNKFALNEANCINLSYFQIEELSVKSKSPEVNEEFEALKEECDGLHRRVDRLEEALDIKENENLSLCKSITQKKQFLLSKQLKDYIVYGNGT